MCLALQGVLFVSLVSWPGGWHKCITAVGRQLLVLNGDPGKIAGLLWAAWFLGRSYLHQWVVCVLCFLLLCLPFPTMV